MKKNVGIISNENYVRIRCLLLLRLCERLPFFDLRRNSPTSKQVFFLWFFFLFFVFFPVTTINWSNSQLPSSQTNKSRRLSRPCSPLPWWTAVGFAQVQFCSWLYCRFLQTFTPRSRSPVEPLSKSRAAPLEHVSAKTPTPPPLFFFSSFSFIFPPHNFHEVTLGADPQFRKEFFFFFSLFRVFNLTSASGIIVISHICGIRGALRSHPINGVTFWRIPR